MCAGLRNYWERRRGKRLHPFAVMATGASASAAAQILTYPLALVRVRMQAQASTVPPVSMRHCIAAIARADGMSGFYRVRPLLLCYVCVLLCMCPGTCLWLPGLTWRVRSRILCIQIVPTLPGWSCSARHPRFHSALIATLHAMLAMLRCLRNQEAQVATILV